MKLLYIVGHPFDIPVYIGFSNILKLNNSNPSIDILLIEHNYFDSIRPLSDALLSEFGSIYKIPDAKYRRNFIAGTEEVINFRRNIKFFFNRNKYDYIILSAETELTNLLILNYIDASKTIVLRQPGLQDDEDILKKNYKLNLPYTLLANYYAFLAGKKFVKIYRNISGRSIKLRKFIGRNPYTYRWNMLSANSDVLKTENDVYFPFYYKGKYTPDFADIKAFFPDWIKEEQKMVIFFGGAFLTWEWAKKNKSAFAEKINHCLDYISENYKDHLLIYKPHPMETNESQSLKLKNYKILKDNIIAEILFMLFNRRISITVSIKSTASKTSLAFGIPAYVLLEYLEFPQGAIKQFRDVTGNLNETAYIKTLSQIGNDYYKTSENDQKIFEDKIINSYKNKMSIFK